MMKFLIELPDNMRWTLDKYQVMFELQNLDAIMAKLIDPPEYGLTRSQYMSNMTLMRTYLKTLAPIILQIARATEIVETEAEHVCTDSCDSVRPDIPSP